jgi:alpha-tubulin suppressor-like RCC1 family protein
MTNSRRPQIVVALFVAAILPLGIAPAAANAASVSRITAIAVAPTHACALTGGGGVKCWGYGLYGQLGTGTATTSLIPVDVAGLSSGVRAIAAGSLSSCAVTAGRGVKCWGYGKFGELGTGTRNPSLIPVDVVGLTSGVTAIAMGDAFTCALTVRGGVKCWGSIMVEPLVTAPSLVPVDVEGLASGVTAIAAGYDHACALTSAGGVRCWGYDRSGQLGNGSTANTSVPVDVIGLGSAVTAISAGFRHTCALTTRGGVKCWGYNGYGQLGDGSIISSSVPVDVSGLGTGVRAISAGSIHSCAVTSNGAAKCWGSNISGQLGHGTANSRTPLNVASLASGTTAILAGNGYSCALTSSGAVKCWGSNYLGQLGNGTRTDSQVPVLVDFATHQTIVLRTSEPAGTIDPGTAVTLTASIRPLGSAGERATVRFEIYRQDDGVWRLAARRDVAADATGRASLQWTFVTMGSRYVRAMALSNLTYAASGWCPRVLYAVE